MLFKTLKRLGCGAVMLAALIAMFSLTQSVIDTVLVTVILGVRQGSSTSCLLFMILSNDIFKTAKNGIENVFLIMASHTRTNGRHRT